MASLLEEAIAAKKGQVPDLLQEAIAAKKQPAPDLLQDAITAKSKPEGEDLLMEALAKKYENQPTPEDEGTGLFPRDNFSSERYPEITMAPEAREGFSPQLEGPVREISQEEIDALKQQKKDLEKVELTTDLLKQGVRANVNANLIGRDPGASHFSKNRVADIMEKYVPPEAIADIPSEQLEAAKQEIIDLMRAEAQDQPPSGEEPPPEKKEESPWLQRLVSPNVMAKEEDRQAWSERNAEPWKKDVEEKVKGGAASTLSVMDLVLNAPTRALAEAFETMRRGANWYGQGMKDEPPESHFLDAIRRRPKGSSGFGEFFRNSYQQSVGGRDLNQLEHALATILGMGFDIKTGGDMLKGVMPYRRVPTQQAIKENIGQVLQKTEVPVGREVGQINPSRVEAVARRSAQPYALPDRVAMVRAEMQKVGQMVGMNPVELQRLDAALLRQMGEQGRFLGKVGNYPTVSRTMFPLSQRRIGQIQAPQPLDLPFGAEQLPGRMREAGRAVQSVTSASRGAPEGVQDVIRKAEGEQLAAMPVIQRNAKAIGKSFSSVERAENTALYQDAKAIRARAERDLEKAVRRGEQTESLRAAHAQAVAREEEMALRGWDLQNPKEKSAWQFMRQSFDDLHREEQKDLGTIGFVENYIMRKKTKEAQALRQKYMDKTRGITARPSFVKHRKDWKEGITLADDFELHPAVIYAERNIQSVMARAAARAEQNVLKSYGRRIPAEMSDADVISHGELTGKPIRIWEQKTGAEAGTRWILDDRAHDLLGKTFDFKAANKAVQAFQSAMGWWKGRATVTKVSFINRNFFLGNLMNMVLGEVSMDPKLARDAMRVMSAMKLSHFGEATNLEKLTWGIGTMGADLDTVVQGKKVRDWIAIMGRNKVMSPGVVAYETGTAGQSAATAPSKWSKWYNPMSSSFFVQKGIGATNSLLENWCKVWTMMDRVKKGHTEWEGARAVADFLFNYDEVSRLLGNPATTIMSAFPKWKYKNYGLQIASIKSRPDKLAQYLSAQSGIQNIDPTDAKQVSLGMAITKESVDRQAAKERSLPSDMNANEWFRVPLMRGAEGSRRFFPQRGATPMGQLGELCLDKLLKGEVGDWAGAVAMTLTDWLGPLPNYALQKWVLKKTGLEPTWAGVRPSTESNYTPAPTTISYLMDYLRTHNEKLYNYLIDDTDWVRPQVVDARGEKKPIQGEYLWKQEFRDFIETVDPGFGVVRRAFPPGEESQDYSGRHYYFGFGKLTDFTEPRMMRWNKKKNEEEILKPLATEKKRQKQAGERVNPR